ncbi:hypothetical protein AB0L83_32005 [Streptomyces sp. NPDC052071]|uniref:hypothetical protein n=1 Tax=Streptomyces sp. NPDC052071 TaxID=3156666 RepID=UPI00341C316C
MNITVTLPEADKKDEGGTDFAGWMNIFGTVVTPMVVAWLTYLFGRRAGRAQQQAGTADVMSNENR